MEISVENIIWTLYGVYMGFPLAHYISKIIENNKDATINFWDSSMVAILFLIFIFLLIVSYIDLPKIITSDYKLLYTKGKRRPIYRSLIWLSILLLLSIWILSVCLFGEPPAELGEEKIKLLYGVMITYLPFILVVVFAPYYLGREG